MPNPALNYTTPPRKRPSLDFAYTGVLYCGIMMFMGLAAVNSQANLLFGVFGLMIGVLLVSVTLSRLVLKDLRVQRVLPEHAVVGQGVVLGYECSNEKRYWPSLSVTVAELDGTEAFTRQPLAYMLHAAPGTTAVIGTELMPKRRGLHTLKRYQITTSFPFGFLKRSLEFSHADTLLVYPPIGRVDPNLLRRCRGSENGGAMLRPRRGGNDEFFGLKEYRQGENPRLIYWRRTAHTGVLVSKEMTVVAPPRLLIIVDTFRTKDTVEEDALIERTIAMAATLASHALEAGLMVGLFVWSGQWSGITPNRGKRHSRDLMAALAQLPGNTLHDCGALLEQARPLFRTGTTPVLITPLDGGDSSDGQQGGMIKLSSRADPSKSWITFDPAIKFAEVIPAAQRSSSASAKKTRSKKNSKAARRP